jgi:Na+/H+ antiporter NhaD/arsenite permease-like protein
MEELVAPLTWDTSMLVSGVILAVTFVGIFTEAVHGFHRTKFAMGGAGLMILAGQYFGFYDTELAVEAVDWNVVFLLGGMMTIVGIMIPTGGFQYLAYKIADITKGRLFFMMALMGTLVTVLSLLLDNVTTVVIFGPLIILICRSMNVTPIPYLLAAALLSDTGGVATLVGDPPNLMIGSAADISFNTFVYHMGGLVFAAWIVILYFLKILFRAELAEKPEMPDFSQQEVIKDPQTWYTSLWVLGGMTILFILHHNLHWEPWFVAAIGLTAIVFIAHHIELDEAFSKTELSLLMFFISLFILVGGVEHSQFLMYIGQYILPFVQADLLTACLVLMWASAVFSAAIDNIPFTAAMIPIIMGMETQGVNVTPLWWALAVGVGMGGNGTHLGSTANVFIVTISERLAIETGESRYRITPGLWFRKGTPVMILTLIVSSIIFWTFFDFYANPLPSYSQ